jgi:dUTP diphosphatase
LLSATQSSLEAVQAERTRDAEEERWEPWPTSSAVKGEPAADAEPELVEDDEIVFEDSILGSMTNGAPTSTGGGNGHVAVEEDAEVVEEEEEFEPEEEPERDPAQVPSSHPASFEQHMEIRFQRLSEKATLPNRAHEGDAGMDLCAAEAASIGPGQRVQVGTGLAVEIPEGWAGMVLPRSGLALKNGISLVNAPGLIDPGYRGEIRILLLNTDPNSEFKVAVGDRIAQLVLTPFSTARPVEADDLPESERGGAGFGSSGR